MNTLEMIKDWQESGFKKKYRKLNAQTEYPVIARNNGFGVLFIQGFSITIGDPVKYSKIFSIDDKNLDDTWEEIVDEYEINQAISFIINCEPMTSLASGRTVYKSDDTLKFTVEEVRGNWIQKF